MHDCIETCWRCRNECQTTLFNHCLSMGGDHVAGDHVKIMMDCIHICQTAADFMTRGSDFHVEVCDVCADICDACADSCEEIGSPEMERCANFCRQCAESCRKMGEEDVFEDHGAAGFGISG